MNAKPDQAYAIVVVDGVGASTVRSGLSHVEGMMLAERLQREGKLIRVMHVVGSNSYEVDRYPPR